MNFTFYMIDNQKRIVRNSELKTIFNYFLDLIKINYLPNSTNIKLKKKKLTQ